MKHPNFEHVKTHVFLGTRYNMLWHAPRKGLPKKDKYCGSCLGHDEHKNTPGPKEISIWPKQPDQEILATVIHECGHACFPNITEKAMDIFECELMCLLRRMRLKKELFERA